jgi:ribonuclease P protein component
MDQAPHTARKMSKRAGRQWSGLLRRADFLRVGASRLRRVTPGFILQAAPRENADGLRLGFTASRKVGNAVARNRAKRRLRALADQVMPQAADPALDYVFVARGETLERNFASMAEDLRQALRRLKRGRAS